MNERDSQKSDFTHLNRDGSPRMVDVGEKQATLRTATAVASIVMNDLSAEAIRENSHKKGDVIQIAELAGVMATKQTANLIPLCHVIGIDGVEIQSSFASKNCLDIVVTVRTHGKTGVEMEALTGASIAALTVYDMCKSIDRTMEIKQVRLSKKTGGKSGDFTNT